MVYMLLGTGFEETEAIAPFDMVKRAGEDAVFVSVSNNKTVTGAHGIKIVADIFMNEISAENGKMIVLPGGKLGVENLDKAEGFDETIKSFEHETQEFSIVNVKLVTGRTHQIRVQFASRKTPLTGDAKYGSKDRACDIALHSYRIRFNHPTENREMVFQSKPDFTIYPWNLFGDDINA